MRTKKAIVTFDNAPAGLFPTFSELEGFEIAGADKKFYPAKAKIVGRTNTVEVWSEDVAQPVACAMLSAIMWEISRCGILSD